MDEGTLIKISKKLQKFEKSDNFEEEKYGDIIKLLIKNNLSFDLVKKYQIGVHVNKLKKRCGEGPVKQLAKQLITSWKQIFNETNQKKMSNNNTHENTNNNKFKQNKKINKTFNKNDEIKNDNNINIKKNNINNNNNNNCNNNKINNIIENNNTDRCVSPKTPDLPMDTADSNNSVNNLNNDNNNNYIYSEDNNTKKLMNIEKKNISNKNKNKNGNNLEKILIEEKKEVEGEEEKQNKEEEENEEEEEAEIDEDDDPIRQKSREVLLNSILLSGEKNKKMKKFVWEAEKLIFEEFKMTDIKYKNRIRSRISNLKDPKNPAFREKVRMGEISSERFATMTPEEMASDQMKQIRNEMNKKSIKEAHIPTMAGAKSDLFKCSRCGKRETNYNQVQTLSGDEPMTTFVVCLNCGNRWRFS